jgi:hypothetical protein
MGSIACSVMGHAALLSEEWMLRITSSDTTRQKECWLGDRNRAALHTNNSGTSTWKSAIAVSWVLLVGCVVATPAQAGFIGDYNFGNFSQTVETFDPTLGTLFNTDPNAGATYDGVNDIVTLTGLNDGSGNPGEVDLYLTVLNSGLLSFQYSFATLDLPFCGTGTDPCDPAGFYIESAFTPIAGLDGDSGTVTSLAVTAGQRFGFRIQTADNANEPGILTISNFSSQATSTSPAVPEPGTLSLMLLAGLTAAGSRWRSSRARRSQEETQ